MRTAISVGIVLAIFILGDAVFNKAKMAHGIQHWFYNTMVGG